MSTALAPHGVTPAGPPGNTPAALAHLTPEQLRSFLASHQELHNAVMPWLMKWAQQFDEHALLYSLLVNVARLSQHASVPINADGFAAASVTAYEVATAMK